MSKEIITLGVTEDEAAASLEKLTLKPLEKPRHVSDLSVDEIDTEIEALGDPMTTVRAINDLFNQAKDTHEAAVEQGEKAVARILQHRQDQEAVCRTHQARLHELKTRRNLITQADSAIAEQKAAADQRRAEIAASKKKQEQQKLKDKLKRKK